MKATVLVIVLAVAIGLAGCLETDGRIDGQPGHVRRPQDGVPTVDVSKMKGPFTIYCRRFIGLDRHAETQRHLRALERFGMANGYTIDEPGGTVLYYGTYPAHDSPLAKRDLATIRRFMYGQPREKAFPGAALTPVRRPPVEYFPLRGARNDALYSLMIAVFSGPQSEGRTFQESAVMLAKERRAKGYEAYVHHGDTSSAVCLGAFVPEAIYIETRVPMLSPDPGDLARLQTGTEEAARRTKVVDARAKALQKEFPRMFVNGGLKWRWVFRQAGKLWTRRKVYAPTVFVEIPGRRVSRRGVLLIDGRPQ